jgi:hypothetical protein
MKKLLLLLVFVTILVATSCRTTKHGCGLEYTPKTHGR